MAKRETFFTNLKCPVCGGNGEAEWEENENPVYYDGLDRILRSLPPGFQRGEGVDSGGDTNIICEKCKVLIAN